VNSNWYNALVPDSSLTPVIPFPRGGTKRSFVSGKSVGSRLRVEYFQRASDGRLVARVWFGPGSEGAPGIAHGGAVAAVLDEAMGASAWLAGYPSVSARLVIDFRGMVPLGTNATIETWVESVEGRKVSLRAKMVDADGIVLAEGEALFVTIDVAVLTERT
jgi:acyl-coenzyme A thioesterase PaaI-like protein